MFSSVNSSLTGKESRVSIWFFESELKVSESLNYLDVTCLQRVLFMEEVQNRK